MHRLVGWVSLLLLAGVIAALPPLAAVAHAHASLVGSDPPTGTVLPVAPPRVVLTFNEPVAALTLRLVAPDGEIRDLTDATASGASLNVPLPLGLTRGTHLLSWRVASVDGHPVGGAVTFSIGEATASPEDQARARADTQRRVALWLSRVALYAGLMLGCGGVFYAAWIRRRPFVGAGRTFLIGSLGVGVTGAIVGIGLQGADAYDAPLSALGDAMLWRQALSMSQGTTAVVAITAMVLSAVALGRSRHTRSLAALALACVGVALAISGHASSAEPQWLTRPLVLMHAMSVAFWIGSLVPLAVALQRGQSLSELARFSRAIPYGVAVLVISGAALTLIQLREPSALVATSYGWILAAKLILVAILFAIATVNRWVLTAAVRRGEAAAAITMRRNVGVEAVLALVILGLVAGWRFTPPPRALLDASAAPVEVHLHGSQAMAHVRVGQPKDGARTIDIILLDLGFGALEARGATLLLSKPDEGIENLEFSARHIEETTWRVSPVRLPRDGRWHVRVNILIDDFTTAAVQGELDLTRPE